MLEDLEEERCPACAAAAASAGHTGHPAADPAPASTLAVAAMLGALPAFAAPRTRVRVRETGRARAAGTPVLLERDRRDPRRHGVATVPDLPADEAPEADPAGVGPGGAEHAADERVDLAA